MTRIPNIFAALAITAALVAGCSERAATPAADTASTVPSNVKLTPEQLQRVKVITVQPTSYRPIVEATGTVAFNGDNSTQVLSPVSGPVLRVVVNPGATVSKGQPLAYVSSPDFAAAVAGYRKAQAAYRNAKRIADRDSALFKNDALARGELEQAQSDVSAAEADLEAAVQSMEALGVEEAQITAVREGRSAPIEAIIRSPIAGTVVEKLVANGQLLQAGTTPAFTIADLSTVWVMTNVFANDIGSVATGEPADVITDQSRVPIPGRVDYIASLADPATKAVSVRVVAPNLNHILRRDMFVRVRLKASEETRGILIPLSAVLRDDQNLPYVFGAAAGGGFARRPITLGSRIGDLYEVRSGIAAGDRIVTDGALFLQFSEGQ